MARWSRPIGIVVTLALLVVLVAFGLRSEPESTTDLRNGQVFIQDNLWTSGRSQYAVWVAPDGTPYAGRRARGERWHRVDLARLSGNPLATPTADDLHNVYAVGVDAGGGVHVAGNMKASPLHYAHATSDLSHWRAQPLPPSGPAATYPAFTPLPDGTLLFWHQDGDVTASGATVLDALGPGEKRWRRVGTILDGRPSGEIPYLHHVAIDPRTGAIHIMFEWRGNEDVNTTNDVGYARSLDGGRTWQASDGRRLRLPITHAEAETVLDTRPTGSGLINSGGLTLDASGEPFGAATFLLPTGGEVIDLLWPGRRDWKIQKLADLGISGRPQLAGTPDGRVWLLGVRSGEAVAIDVTPGREHLPDVDIAAVPAGWEVNYDSQALARDGVVKMLIPHGSRPHVVEAPLTAR
jgi:hypothetical protein